MKLVYSCLEALTRALDEPLGLLDRAMLQVRLSMCGNCCQVDQQLRVVDDLACDLFGPHAEENIEPNPSARS